MNIIDLAILKGLSFGYSRSEIAESLELKQHKIDTRIQDMIREFQCRNASHLVATALRKGWID